MWITIVILWPKIVHSGLERNRRTKIVPRQETACWPKSKTTYLTMQMWGGSMEKKDINAATHSNAADVFPSNSGLIMPWRSAVSISTSKGHSLNWVSRQVQPFRSIQVFIEAEPFSAFCRENRHYCGSELGMEWAQWIGRHRWMASLEGSGSRSRFY